MCFFNKYVHELVTIDTDFIDARFKYDTLDMTKIPFPYREYKQI